MKLLFLTLLFFNNAFSLNHIDHFYRQYVNHSSDPCDNFYRHACPIGTPSFFIAKNIESNYKKKFDVLLNSTTLIADTADLDNEELLAMTSKLLKIRCEEGKSLDLLLEHLQLPDHLKEEKNCDRLYNIIINYGKPSRTEVIEFNNFSLKLFYRTIASSFIRIILDNDLEDAVIEMKEIIKALVDKANEWVLETPWVSNFDQTKLIQKVLKNMTFVDDYEGLLKELTEKMLTLEIFYRNCKAQYDNIIESSFICFQQTMKNDTTGPEEMLAQKAFWFSSDNNAFNLHPYISMGNVYFQVLKDTTEMAAKLGAAGWVAGHETSHSLIADKFDVYLPYFSEKSVECIQNQFNKTCTEFKEQSCIVKNDQVDENGSDILGMQLVHDLLEKHYNETLNDIYEPLNITYHQLFFYAQAFMWCDGELQKIQYYPNSDRRDEHSVAGVRVNVVAQHPGFQKAFNCPDDSRMMQSATEQCIIYGKDAPESKRRL